MLVNTPTQVIGKRYLLLDSLGAGGMGVVYRATDRLTGQTVALKQVTAPSERLIFASRADDSMDFHLALAHEFKILASLRHPNIISVLDYGFDEARQPYFTMDLLANAQNILDAGRGQPLHGQVSLLIQMLQALMYLHRRGILHRDLKPGNVLVVNGQLKLLDFGLSAHSGDTSAISGTLAYMAPEIFQGQPASEASDLYAVGMIAYELFAGRHPFEVDSITKLIQDIQLTIPDVQMLPVDTGVKIVLDRLLSKDPRDRFTSAGDVIAALAKALDEPLPPETDATRESFLQAARFVGREAEMEKLSAALGQAMQGSGGAWLIGGESGVGKSRLMDELRALALVQGTQVLRGQAVSEGGKPYQIWRDAVRWLALQTDLSELEAGVLKPLIPDISTLIGRPVPDVPDLTPQASQDRLLSVIDELFRRQNQPIMLVLEDMHWAGSESLAVLTRLNRSLHTLSLLVIGTYRDDEAPDLPERFPQTQVLKLKRLTGDHIAALSESMLGLAGRQPELVELLRRETEGNVFFVVEVVRALAEEVGQLDKIGTITLPKHVFTGGIQRIVQRRVSRVPEASRPLLRLVAVAGRQLDLRLVQALAAGANVDQWLAVCADASILEVQDERWRFVHDKLREGLLAELSPADRQAAHKAVAVGMEAVYPNASEQASALAYHWHMAEDRAKEEYYSALAGEQALSNGAYQEAITFLDRALALMPTDLTPYTEQQGATLTATHARRERLLGEAYLGLGRVGESNRHIRMALELLGYPMPAGGGLRLGLVVQLVRQLIHRAWPSWIKRPGRAGPWLEIARNYEQLALGYYWDNRRMEATYAAFMTLNMAEKTDPSRELIRAYANMTVAAGVVPLHGLAKTFLRRVKETAEQVDHPPSKAAAYRVILAYAVGVGWWSEAKAEIDEAIAIAKKYGDYRVLGDVYAHLRAVYTHQGLFEESEQITGELYKLGVRSGNLQHQSWGLSYQAEDALRLGQPDRAVELLDSAMSLYNEKVHDTQQVLYQAGIANVALQLGDQDRALAAADRLTELVANSSPTVSTIIIGYSAATEVYLWLWENNPSRRDTLEKQSRLALKTMYRYAKVFAIGQARAYLWQGLYDWQSENPQKALKSWQQGLDCCQRLNMLHDEGLIRYEIGRHADSADPARKQQLSRAAALFREMNCLYDLSRAETALID